MYYLRNKSVFQKVLKPFIVVALLVGSGCGNDHENNLTNQLTVKHVNIPGTRVSLIPPTSFAQTSNFPGFFHEPTNSSIMVVEMPGSYFDFSIRLTPEALKQQGVIENSREDMVINSYDGLLISATQSAYGASFNKLIYIFGDSTNTIMINGVAPSDKATINEEIERSILSCVYEPDRIIDLYAAVNFEVDVSQTKFKPAHTMAGTLIFTTDGIVPTLSEDKSSISVGESISDVEIGDTRDFSIKRFHDLPLAAEPDSLVVKDILIGDLRGFEITAQVFNEETGNTELIYQVSLFTGSEYYLIVGRAMNNHDDNLAIFRQVTATFRRK